MEKNIAGTKQNFYSYIKNKELSEIIISELFEEGYDVQTVKPYTYVENESVGYGTNERLEEKDYFGIDVKLRDQIKKELNRIKVSRKPLTLLL